MNWPLEFSPLLCTDVSDRLRGHLDGPAPATDATLRALAERICVEARVANAPIERILVTVHAMVRTPVAFRKSLRRNTFEDNLISACVREYFGSAA